MAGNINITNNVSDKAKPLMKSFRVIKGYAGKKSITALSKDLIMQFPVIMSAGIDPDDAVAIAKALEKMFATMFLAVWSADATMAMKDYGMNGVRDFVKQYHNNDDIPDVLTYTGDILSLTDTLIGNECTNVALYSSDGQLSATESAKLWDNVEDSLALESLNDMYLPIKKTQKQIAHITAAMEEITADSIYSAAAKNANRSIDPYAGRTGAGARSKFTYKEIGSNIAGSMGTGASFKYEEKLRDKLTSLEPTMIDVTFLVHGSGAGGNVYSDGKFDSKANASLRHAMVGVKTMVRIVNSQSMIPNVIASIQDQSLAFKFIKYTKGEMKVGRDMLLGISRIKQDASASNQADVWFAALRKRKRAAKTFRFGNSGINPFATLVLTSDEVEQIRVASGYNVMDRTTSKLLMDNLFLLGLVVVDTNTGIVHTLFDGNENFSTTNMKGLKTQVNKGADDADTFREMRKLMGRM